MFIDANTIISASALVAAIAALSAVVYGVIKWFQKQEKQSVDIEELNAEMLVLSSAMLACLDGLKQLGANGKVTEAHDQLEEHLNQRAHGQASKLSSK